MTNNLRIALETKGIRFDSITDDSKKVTKALDRASSEPRTSEPRVVLLVDSKAGNLTTVHQDPETKEVKICNPAGKTEGCAELETLLHEEGRQVTTNTTNYHNLDFTQDTPTADINTIITKMHLEQLAQGQELSKQPLEEIKRLFQETKTRINTMRKQIINNRMQAQIQGTGQLQQASPALMAEINSLPVNKADKALLLQLASSNPEMANLIAAYVKNPTAAAYGELAKMAQDSLKDSATQSKILAFLKSISDAFTQRAPKSSKSGSNRRSK